MGPGVVLAQCPDHAGDRRRNLLGRARLPVTASLEHFLPAGAWVVGARLDAASDSTEIRIEAGKRTEASVVLDAGLVKGAGILAADGSRITRDLRWDIDAADANAFGDLPHFYTAFSQPTIAYFLPAGRYRVRAKLGETLVEQVIDVTAGESREVALRFER